MGNSESSWLSAGLVGLLVLFAAITRAFTAEYPAGIFDFVIGLDRWTLRVVAYAALMTDAYPPFRLDQGGTEPRTAATGPQPDGPPATVGLYNHHEEGGRR